MARSVREEVTEVAAMVERAHSSRRLLAEPTLELPLLLRPIKTAGVSTELMMQLGVRQ